MNRQLLEILGTFVLPWLTLGMLALGAIKAGNPPGQWIAIGVIASLVLASYAGYLGELVARRRRSDIWPLRGGVVANVQRGRLVERALKWVAMTGGALYVVSLF